MEIGPRSAAEKRVCMHPHPLTGTLPTLWENTMGNRPSDNQPDQRMAAPENDKDKKRKPERDADPDAADALKTPIIKPK